MNCLHYLIDIELALFVEVIKVTFKRLGYLCKKHCVVHKSENYQNTPDRYI